MAQWQEVYDEWLNKVDDETRAQLLEMGEADKEDAFASELAFGTAGLRGIIGPGTNRMNKYIIRQTTEGLARWIDEQGGEAQQQGVVISYDNRHYSQEFAYEAARVLGAHNIKTYVFDELTPTPVLSFAVRELGTIAGIMITASHNPPNYNGFKVYGEDGGQFPPESADRLTQIIDGIADSFAIIQADQEELLESGLLEIVGDNVRDIYMEKLKTVTVNRDLAKDMADQIRFVYSPMHGTGTKLALKAFDQAGYTDVHLVEAQAVVDPDFSTVESPNPETEPAFDLSKKLAEEVDADLVFATDPDADRLGVLVRLAPGQYNLLSGNQAASLMLDYLVNQGPLPANGALIRSIVSTKLVDRIASSKDVDVFEVLTGFKFVADKISEFEVEGDSHELVFGFEEAIGYLVKPFVRDKDALQALTLMAEVAAYHKSQGRNLVEALEELYRQYGYFYEETISVQYPGLSGRQKMADIMAEVREAQLFEIAGYPVVKIDDFLTLKTRYADGAEADLDYDASNVLRYSFEDGSFVALRPSGTEPKIKLYMSAVSSESMEAAQTKLEAFKADMQGRIE